MIQSYTLIEWLFFFYLYSFFGWCYESIFVSIRSKKAVNRGFMRGPMLPLYGSGATMMLIVSRPFQNSILLTYLAGCIGATVLEYVTGVAMEALFNVRYWDYSDKRFNFQGYICLRATLLWGFFTVMMTKFVHHPIETIVLSLPHVLITTITVLISIAAIVDFTLSFKAALDLRDVLITLSGMKEELLRMQKRLDVIIAFANDSKERAIQYGSYRTDELIESLENRLLKMRDLITGSEISEDKKEELAQMRIKLGISKENRFQLSHIKDFYRKALIKGNPMMVSAKFKESLEELKSEVIKSKKDKKKED